MKVKEALQKGIADMKTAYIETPALEAGVLLCHVLGCERGWIYTHGDEEMEMVKFRQFSGHVEARCKGTPLQYITGHQEFMSLDFIVNPHVLIPRQDTEVLVETVMGYVKGNISFENTANTGIIAGARSINILDIGTGSGCIAVSLAYYLPGSRVSALDISREALDTARRNAVKAGVAGRMEFVCSNLFNGLTQSGFDAIVSNPPYIPSRDIAGLQTEVREHEPYKALDGGADGLDFYRDIIDEAPQHLRQGGLLAFEVGFDQAGDVSGLMQQDFTDICINKDLSGIERVVTGKLKR